MFKLHIDVPPDFDTRTKKEFFDMVWTRYRMIAMQAFRMISMKTPVDTGRARANWHMTFDEPSNSTSISLKTDMMAQLSILNTVQQGSVPSAIYIANNVMYMDVLEFGLFPKNPLYGSYPKGKQAKGVKRVKSIRSINGFSKQAPQGMIAPTVKELAGFLGM
jgi:hypothetical protein